MEKTQVSLADIIRHGRDQVFSPSCLCFLHGELPKLLRITERE